MAGAEKQIAMQIVGVAQQVGGSRGPAPSDVLAPGPRARKRITGSPHAVARIGAAPARMRKDIGIDHPLAMGASRTHEEFVRCERLFCGGGYPVDHKKIIDSCAANHVVIEINAHPRRLDMDWKYIDYAIEKGVLLSINPDAHALDGFDDVKYGVLAAQKGGLSKENNLSSFSLKEFEEWLGNSRNLKGR